MIIRSKNSSRVETQSVLLIQTIPTLNQHCRSIQIILQLLKSQTIDLLQCIRIKDIDKCQIVVLKNIPHHSFKIQVNPLLKGKKAMCPELISKILK